MWKEGEGVVLKFGGSSVATPERIRAAARRVASFARQGRRTAVVVSAMGKTTDDLLGLARATAPSAGDRRELDRLLATGEQQSAALLAMALSAEGCPARSFSGDEAGFVAEGAWGEGRILSVDPARIEAATAFGHVAVITGFQACTRDGETITLGRGGSDLSAIALAAALGAAECRIFTDVDGIYTADPRVVPGALKLGNELMNSLAAANGGDAIPSIDISYQAEAGKIGNIPYQRINIQFTPVGSDNPVSYDVLFALGGKTVAAVYGQVNENDLQYAIENYRNHSGAFINSEPAKKALADPLRNFLRRATTKRALSTSPCSAKDRA